MNVDQARRFALTLPGAAEQPHFDMSSYRVRNRIFATVPADDGRLHVFVDRAETARVVAEERRFIFVALAMMSVSVGTSRPGTAHDRPVFSVVLAGWLILGASMKLLPWDFVARYVVSVLGLVIVAAIVYSWMAFINRWKTGAAPRFAPSVSSEQSG